MKYIKIFFLFSLIILSVPLVAQNTETENEPAYETIYDEPYAINKLFVGFLPLYGELFATNVNAGFGIDAQYFHHTKFNLKAHARKTYSSKFYDFNRELALKNSTVSNKAEVFNYYEIGGTYHINDFDVYAKGKFLLVPKKDSKNQRISAAYPGMMEVSGKLRKIIGARAGAIIWNSTIDINRTLTKQGLSFSDLRNENNEALPETYIDANGDVQNVNAFSNLYSFDIYLGGSLTLIRNIAVDFEGYQEGVDDGILNLYFDILYAPYLSLDPIEYNGQQFTTTAITTKTFGARLGVDGKFNRKLGWGYGGEIGYRPSIEGRGFFANFRIAFPIYSSNLNKKKQESDAE